MNEIGKIKNAWVGASDTRENRTINEKLSNMSSPVEKMLKTLSEEELQRMAVNRIVGARFLAWFFYWIPVIRSVIGFPRFQDDSLMLEIDFFLHQLEHHFAASAAPREIRNAFRYLRHYFRFYPMVSSLKHVRKAEEMLQRIEEARSLDVEEAGAEVRAWFGNRIWVVLRTIEKPRFKEAIIMMETVFFLNAMETFFVEIQRSRHFRNAFRYLRQYFKTYPAVRVPQSTKAIEMIGRIYQGLDYEFRFQPNLKPSVMELEGKMPRREVGISTFGIHETAPKLQAA